MLSRRHFLTQSGAVVTVTTANSLGLHCTNATAGIVTNLRDVRAPASLGVTMGSIIGTAQKIFVYAVLTRFIPTSIITAFAGVLTTEIISRNYTNATHAYIDYRMSEAENKLLVANNDIRNAMVRDTADFYRLNSVIVEQGKKLDRLRNSHETTVREIRMYKKEIREQLDVFREEESRSDISSTVHQSAKVTLRTGRSEEDAATQLACDQVSHATGTLKKNIQAWQRAIL